MVMFNCNRCSKGLKKKDVLNHSFQCGGRNNIDVTCIDCLKDFRGNEYDSHTSCVTEEVRYGGKGVVAKEAGKKQNQWLGIVRQVLTVNQSLEHPVKKFLESIQHMENIPRNKKKFHNWANSAMHIRDTGFLDKVFEILQIEFQKFTEASQSKGNPKNSSNDVSNRQIDEKPALLEGNDKQKEKHKKDKKNKVKKEVESVEEVVTEENGVNGLHSAKKRKKKTKEDANASEELKNGSGDQSFENQTEESDGSPTNGKCQLGEEPVGNEEPMKQGNGEALETTEDNTKLSKKERKMKKKKARFDAELREIENFKKEEEPGDGVVIEEAPKTKKSKKRKLVSDELNDDKPEKDHSDEKDSKRLKADEDQDNGGEEPAGGSPLKKKFQWHQMIIDVLKKSKKDEVSVKKVTKKVINEYISMYGDLGIHEKLNAKMTKKLKTCPGIRVLKDKVKLIETEE